MNTVFLFLGSALAAATAATVATVSVITTQRPEMPSGFNELTTISSQILNEQRLLRANMTEMVEAQQEMLHRNKQEKASIQNEKNRAKDFFERNMDSMGGSPNTN